MKSLNTKLALSALAVAVLATPALAASKHQPQVQSYQSYEGLQNSTVDPASSSVGVYPNGAIRSGSVYSRESGADDNVIR
jgi:hypothetical protein